MSTKAERRKTQDWTGQRWGSLVALAYAFHGNDGARWRFQCDCGHRGTYYLKQVQRGERTTCGCDAKPAPKPEPKPFVWPFPLRLGTDRKPLSPVWRAYANA